MVILSMLLVVLVIACGCSSGAGKAPLTGISGPPSNEPARDAGPPWELDRIPEGVGEPGEQLYSLAIQYEEGAEYRYELTNDMVNRLPDPIFGQMVTVKSDLTATQTARIEQLDGSGAVILINTFNVESNVEGDEEVAILIQDATAGIEGSLMRGNYDEFGRGTDVFLERGIGLSPIGAQAGDEDLIVGLMGLLLPPTPVTLADEWLGSFDFTAQVGSFFVKVGGTVENGEFPIVYALEQVNEEENYAVIGIRSEGRPTIILALVGDETVSSEMHVLMEGRALIDLDTGWLREMKVTTTVDYSGFMPGVKQVVQSTTRRVSIKK